MTATCLVSVVIPSYNRFRSLQVAVESVRAQKLRDLETEIIVVNDGSTDAAYYRRWPGVTVVHLAENTRRLLGYASAGFVRNCGVRVSRGDYVAFLDDDDAFLPHKLQTQVDAMRNARNLFSATDAYLGHGAFSLDKLSGCQKYNAEFYRDTVLGKLRARRFPHKVTPSMLRRHNLVITSSVVFHKSLLHDRIMREDLPMGGKNEQGVFLDYEFWCYLCSRHPLMYLDEPLTYYDFGHAGKQLY